MSDQESAGSRDDETTVSEQQVGGTKDDNDSNEGPDAPRRSNSDEAVAEAIDSVQSAASSSDGTVGGGNESGFGSGSAPGTDSGSGGVGDDLGVGHGGAGEEVGGREPHPIPPAPFEEENSHLDGAAGSLTLNGSAGECPGDETSKEEAFVDAPDHATRSPPSSVGMDEGPMDDAVKEEAFVDAPDQLVPAEGRKHHFEESTVVIDRSVIQLNDCVDGSDNTDCVTMNRELARKMEQEMEEMRDQLDKTRDELKQAVAARDQMKQELAEHTTSFSISTQSWQVSYPPHYIFSFSPYPCPLGKGNSHS